MSLLEVAANICNLTAVYLASRNHIYTWWASILACTLMGLMFFEVKLYADVTLQIIFVGFSIYGIWNWKYGSASKRELPITRLHVRNFIALLFLALVGTVSYALLLHHFTDASLPFADSIILMASLLAQGLLVERKLENWAVWVLVNITAIPLYFYKGLYLTGSVYILFLINAFYGLYRWNKLMREQR